MDKDIFQLTAEDCALHRRIFALNLNDAVIYTPTEYVKTASGRPAVTRKQKTIYVAACNFPQADSMFQASLKKMKSAMVKQSRMAQMRVLKKDESDNK